MTAQSTSLLPQYLGRLTVGPQSPALRQVLWSLVREAKQADLMAPVTIISPSRYASLSLRQELGESGFVNVRFIQLPVLSELLGGAALAAEGRKPLTSTLQSISLRRALIQTEGVLRPVRNHPKTQASVRASFHELRRLDEATLEELKSHDGVSAEVVQLYRKFRQDVGQDWYDAEDLTTKAAEAVDQDKATALNDLGHIVFFLPRSPSPAETTLMQALAQRGSCSVVLGVTSDSHADEPIADLVKALEPSLGPAKPVGESDSSLPPSSDEVQLHIAANTHEELRWVIRQIVEEAGSKGAPFHRLAVLYRMESPYGTLIRDELNLAGIPMAGPGRDSLADTPAGRTLLGLLDLAGNDFRRDEVMAWLTGCPVSPPKGKEPNFSPSQWDAISRQAGIVGGLSQWQTRLEAFERHTIEKADSGEAAEEISEGRAAAMRASAGIAGELREFLQNLAQAVTAPPPGSSWTAFCDWACRLMDMYISRALLEADDAPQNRLEEDKERIAQILDDLRAADSINPSTTEEEFRQVLADSLQVQQGHLGPTGQGVFVSSFATAAGMSFDAIWMVGMIEGGAPPAIRPDPLLPETSQRRSGVPTRAEQRIARERYDYLSALATAPRRVLSFPVAETASRREAHPSRWFLEQATALVGRQVHSSTLPSLSGSPWLSISESAEHALTNLNDVRLADTLDYNLHRLIHWKKDGRRATQHPIAAQGTLARASRLGRSRNSARLTEFDGNLSPVAEDARFGRNLRNQVMSATRLEAWAGCPFRYFLGNVLRLGALDTPEDTTTISAMDRGSLVHKILEQFIIQTNAIGALPLPRQQWGEPDRSRLMRIADAEFQAAEAQGITGKRLLWELVKQNILDDLDTFLVEEGKLRARNETGQVLVEASFGLDRGTPEVVDPATGLRFRGYIDRVDVSADGTTVLVVDYKTGSAGPYTDLKKDAIDHGKRLQLGIYSLAAQHLVPGASRFQAAYWFTSGGGGFQFAPPDFFHISDEDTAQRFREGALHIVSGIQAGAFPANPGPVDRDKYTNCRFCDFDSLCPSRRGDTWDRKKNDPLVVSYRELAEDAVQQDTDGEVE